MTGSLYYQYIVVLEVTVSKMWSIYLFLLCNNYDNQLYLFVNSVDSEEVI